MQRYHLILISCFILLITGIPSCRYDDCFDDSYDFRIDSYHFSLGEATKNTEDYLIFEEADSIHISKFWIQMVPDSVILVENNPSTRFSIISSAYACKPSIQLVNRVSDVIITASETLNFQGLDYLAGTDISDFFESVYWSSEFSGYSPQPVGFGFKRIPSGTFKTKFRFEITTYDGGTKKTQVVDSKDIVVYF